MPRVTLKHPPCMTSEEVENAPHFSKGRFWVGSIALDEPDGMWFDSFLRIGDHRADAPLFLQIDIPYGKYVLGCGYGRNTLRRPFEVTLLGVKF